MFLLGTTTTDSGAEGPKGETLGLTSQEKTEEISKETADKQEETTDKRGYNKKTWVDRQELSLPESMPIYKDFLVAWSTAPGKLQSLMVTKTLVRFYGFRSFQGKVTFFNLYSTLNIFPTLLWITDIVRFHGKPYKS